MGYYIVYVEAGADGPGTDGPDVATGRGWADFGTHVLDSDRHEQYPETAHLCQEGWVGWGADEGGEGAPETADDLEHELEELTHAGGDVGPVAARLLAALRERTPKCAAVIVTDGTAPGGDEDDEE